MKPIYYLISFCMGACSLMGHAAINEPETSKMATGHWVKIRVDKDAIYELTYYDLLRLGFSEPEKVNVYGYNPTLLLTHNVNLIPSDVSPVHTLHSEDYKKIIFYGKGDTDLVPELWSTPTTSQEYDHKKHSYSVGATYFLSDIDSESLTLPTIAAPAAVSESVMTSHTSLIYHEEDVTNVAEGGIWFGGSLITGSRKEETHTVEVKNMASGNATLAYAAMLSPTLSGTNTLLASYSNGVMSEAAKGTNAAALSNHALYNVSQLRQALAIPIKSDVQSFDITFSVHPTASAMERGAMLDYFGLMYNRQNDVSNEAQLHMFFENTDSEKLFCLEGADSGEWHAWNVGSAMSPKEVLLLEEDGLLYGNVAKAATNTPNEVIAFNVAATQLKPELIGAVDNQNLHSLEVPDLVIVTSKLLLPSAEKIADLHKRLQGLDVAVVDQQQIFNEYSSGNISPEGVRRFLSHLYAKNDTKLKGVLLLGPATYNQHTEISDELPNVVTAQCERLKSANAETTAYATDAFFGCFGNLVTGGNWSDRRAQMQILANEAPIAIGRVPLNSEADIEAYYSKVEKYLTENDTYGGIGNVLIASDYSSADEEHHLSNAEGAIASFGDKAGKTITTVRAASNLLTKTDNKMAKSITNLAFCQGISFFAYFGHGEAKAISGSNQKADFLFDLNSASQLNNTGKYPIVFFGSCKVGTYDRGANNLSNSFLKNANGGAVTVIASGREVYQKQNQEICEAIIKRLMSEADGTWLGRIWTKAQHDVINVTNATRDNIINHLTYNFLGDPAVPLRGETHSVQIDNVDEVVMTAQNHISGTVNRLDGGVDSNFNGRVKITIYDVIENRANILGNIQSSSHTYYQNVQLDQSVIGEVVAEVKNGRFEADYTGPTSVKTGTHRFHAFAYSNDGTQRGLGYLSGVEFKDPEAETTLPTGVPTEIRSFGYANGALEAEVYIPLGLGATTSLLSPITLTIDNVHISHVQNFARHETGNICKIKYPVASTTDGRHTATLAINDASGEWIQAECIFSTITLPEARLTAAVKGENVTFEVASSVSGTKEKRLIIERLNGDVVVSKDFTGNSETITLNTGVYRAFVQLQDPTSATATEKIEVLID